MSLLSKKSLAKKLLKAKRFRDGFVSARIAQTLALQARVMREEGGLSQTQLAKELDTSQNAIYRLENPSFAKSISTLIKVASFFDVGLVVRFERFSGIVDWVSDMDSESILIPSAESDVRLQQIASGWKAADPTEAYGDAGLYHRTDSSVRQSMLRTLRREELIGRVIEMPVSQSGTNLTSGDRHAATA